MFHFLKPGLLQDDELQLLLARRLAGNRSQGQPPSYQFKMLGPGQQQVGHIELRIGRDKMLTCYQGHLGYVVWPDFRGRRYAARSIRLLLPLARQHGLDTIWINCDPTNHASRRTCELAGATLVEIMPLPPGLPIFRPDRSQLCRYRLSLSPAV